jgi:hypothetical protein
VRVHTHDAQAKACPAAIRTSCEQAIVVDAVLWTGDAVTETSPLSVAAAADRFGQLQVLEMLHNVQQVSTPLFLTAPAAACGAPWPVATFEVHGDPRFGLFAVFPDTASRQRFQAGMDPTAVTGCSLDPGVVRPGPGQWVGSDNALALVFGSDVVQATAKALGTSASAVGPAVTVPFPPTGYDESYLTVADFEAARLAGTTDVGPQPWNDSGYSYQGYTLDIDRRYAANALTYTIGPGRAVTQADVSATVWHQIETSAVPGTARIYTVTHPDTSDPALRTEVLVAFEWRVPSVGTWALILVRVAPYPTAH